MTVRRQTGNRGPAFAAPEVGRIRPSSRVVRPGSRNELRCSMATKQHVQRNEYRCAIEVNQAGKYCVRIRVSFARHAWVLSVYFLASSFDRAMKKLEQSLQ